LSGKQSGVVNALKNSPREGRVVNRLVFPESGRTLVKDQPLRTREGVATDVESTLKEKNSRTPGWFALSTINWQRGSNDTSITRKDSTSTAKGVGRRVAQGENPCPGSQKIKFREGEKDEKCPDASLNGNPWLHLSRTSDSPHTQGNKIDGGVLEKRISAGQKRLRTVGCARSQGRPIGCQLALGLLNQTRNLDKNTVTWGKKGLSLLKKKPSWCSSTKLGRSLVKPAKG